MKFDDDTRCLTSAQMEGLFRDVFDSLLAQRHFSFIGNTKWARETEAEFKHLFYFYPFRPGAAYRPFGALSFDYVPRLESLKSRLRKDTKHARVHLVVTRIGFGADSLVDRTPAKARQKCESLREIIINAIRHDLDGVQTIPVALELLRREKATSNFGFYNTPETALSYAFTLAKVGNKAEAECELETLLAKSNFYPVDTHVQLRELLSQALDQRC